MGYFLGPVITFLVPTTPKTGLFALHNTLNAKSCHAFFPFFDDRLHASRGLLYIDVGHSLIWDSAVFIVLLGKTAGRRTIPHSIYRESFKTAEVN